MDRRLTGSVAFNYANVITVPMCAQRTTFSTRLLEHHNPGQMPVINTGAYIFGLYLRGDRNCLHCKEWLVNSV